MRQSIRPAIRRFSPPLRNGVAGLMLCLVAACGGSTPIQAPRTDLVGTLEAAGRYGTFLDAVRTAGLITALRAPGPLTVFAPTDEAFANLPRGVLGNLMASSNRSRLRRLVLNHIVEGRVTAASLTGKRSTLRSRADMPIEVDARQPDKGIFYARARVTGPALEATNGLVHPVDRVVLPLK